MDKFPEAFRRFENDVDIGKLESYRQLTVSFRWWAGQRWKGTTRQWHALNAEAENLGFEVPSIYGYRSRSSWSSGNTTFIENRAWREENFVVDGKSRIRYRDVRTGRFIKKP